MRRDKTIVLIMTALLSLTAAAIMYTQARWNEFPFSVVLKTDGGEETIKCWKKDDTYYIFLPSGADPDQARIVTNPLFPIRIDGRSVDGDTVCGAFPLFEKLPLSYRKWGKTQEEAVSFCKSGNVPAMYIDTASGSMDYIHKEKGNAEPGKLRLYRDDGTLDCDAQISAINGRGNSTWSNKKKPYSFELTQSSDLLGMGAAKRWILLANSKDSSNICNKMCYDFAARAGCAYTPECQWVDLYLNGNYVGLYLLSERNEVDSQRVDIPMEGSFLISKEWETRIFGRSYDFFFTRREYFYRIHHAGMEVDWAREIWQSVEDALFSEDGIDPRTGKSWDELIDVDSWARQFLIWDCFVDIDAAHLSKFFYYDPRSDLVYAGPLWDMDVLYLGMEGYPISVLASGRRYILDLGQESMFYHLSQKDGFRQALNRIYREEFRPLLLELAETGIDQYRQKIHTASFLNDVRWDIHDAEYTAEEKKSYLRKRIDFLDEYLGFEDDYCVICLRMTDYNQWRSFAVKRGETADFLISQGITWLDYETGEPFDLTAPITRDRLAVEEGALDCPADESPMEYTQCEETKQLS